MSQTEQSATDIPKAYDPASVEQRLYKFWTDGGFFTPKMDPSKEPFAIIMPPPNVTESCIWATPWWLLWKT